MIPLSLQGVSSSFPTRKPTIEEFKSLSHLCLTNADVPYDPADPIFAQQEQALTQELLQTGDRIGATPPSRQRCSVSKTLSLARLIGTGQDRATQLLHDISSMFDNASFLESLVSISALKQMSTQKQFDPDILARNWISIAVLLAERWTSQRNVASERYCTRLCRDGSEQTTGKNSGIGGVHRLLYRHFDFQHDVKA